MQERTCPGCETTFIPRGRQKFCSRRCQSRLWQRNRLGIVDPGLTARCWWCESEFRRLDGRRFYCSAKCARVSELLAEIQRKYGISKDQYRATYFQQNGKCAVCRKPERTARNTLLTIDHDHVTSQFRGLLCSQCNRAIGLLNDDPRVIAAAAEYVKRHRQLKLL